MEIDKETASILSLRLDVSIANAALLALEGRSPSFVLAFAQNKLDERTTFR